MGAYLSEPITKKEIETEENGLMAMAACSMQGWRVTQEVNLNRILRLYSQHNFLCNLQWAE
jgi:hypothetical protein